MDNSQACQLFKYDHEFFLVTKNSPEYFANEFVENAIDTDSDDNIIYLNISEILYIYAHFFIY